MDKISIAGLVMGLVAIVGGQVLEGGHVSSLVQPTAFLIVIGGTLGAVMLQSPLPIFVEGMKMGRWVFFPPDTKPQGLIRQIVNWSQIARKEGLLALESQIGALRDPFARKGLQLLVDGAEPERLKEGVGHARTPRRSDPERYRFHGGTSILRGREGCFSSP